MLHPADESQTSFWCLNLDIKLLAILGNLCIRYYSVYITTDLNASMFYFEDTGYISGTKIKHKTGLFYLYINMIKLEVSNFQLCNSL